MTIVEIPYTNSQVWHGSSRSDRMFLRDAVFFWFDEQKIPRRCYAAVAVGPTDVGHISVGGELPDEHGVFLFDNVEDATLFKLTWG